MPDYIVCTRAIKGGSFSSEPRPPRFRTILNLSKVKRIGDAPRNQDVPKRATGKEIDQSQHTLDALSTYLHRLKRHDFTAESLAHAEEIVSINIPIVRIHATY
jgi:hypothetical protein